MIFSIVKFLKVISPLFSFQHKSPHVKLLLIISLPEYYSWIETVTNGFDVRLWNVTELIQSIHIFDNFAFTSINVYMKSSYFCVCLHLSACISIILILGDKIKN